MTPAGVLSGFRVRGTVSYDGTAFCGFQIQPEQRTVQGVLEDALYRITQRQTRVVGAGRTDSGVHAQAQVVAFEAHWQHGGPALQRALNAVLPEDVVIAALSTASDGFHPRFSATGREYQYTIWNHPVRNPLLRYQSYWVPRPLDVEQMDQAAALLIGEHDFATFGRPPQGTCTIRRIERSTWSRDGSVLRYDISANAFLYRMVRSIVGTLLMVGKGDLDVQGVKARLEAVDRRQAGPTAPANGLSLMAVQY